MEAAEYQRLHCFESWYWWYRAQRANLVGAIGELALPRKARVLDAGCGTGRNLTELSRSLAVSGFGVDASPHAAAFWNGEADVHRSLASLNELPYADNTFDAVCSVDVLGCASVRITTAFAELVRVLRLGGNLVVLVPAYPWLLSPHDAAVHSIHRFTRSELRGLARDAGLTVTRLTHRFALFFPLIVAARLLSRVGARSPKNGRGSDLAAIPRWLNAGLHAIARTEHLFSHRISVPFGTTLLMVARKERM